MNDNDYAKEENCQEEGVECDYPFQNRAYFACDIKVVDFFTFSPLLLFLSVRFQIASPTAEESLPSWWENYEKDDGEGCKE